MRCSRLIAVMGVLMLAAPLQAQERGEFRSRIDTTVTLADGGTVQLGIVSGGIKVSSWTRNEVKVHATSESGDLQFDASPSRVQLQVRADRGDEGDTEFEITIPATARLVASSVSGDISAQGGRDAEINSVSGDITASRFSGRAQVTSVSGGVTLAEAAGGARASSVSGDLHLSGITGDLNARTVSGEITLLDVRSSYVHAESVSGDERFSGPLASGGRYEFRTHSGDVELGIPSGGASVSFSTFSGSAHSDFPMTLAPGSATGRRQEMQFTINGGGATVSVTSFSGDLTIHRASGANREN